MRRLFALAAVLMLVTAACKLETNFGAVINADGSGTVIVEVGVDDEAAELFLTEGDPFDGNDLVDEPGARTREERRGDLTYYIIELDVADVAAIERQILGDSNSLLSDLSITVTDQKVTVSGTATAEESLGGEAEGFDPAVFEDSISANVYFTMPGSITSHNADRQDGNTLYWEVPVLGGTLNIQAESDPTGTPASGSSDGFPTWAYAVLGVLVLAALWYFMKGRSPVGTPTAATPETTTTEDDPPAPPPAE